MGGIHTVRIIHRTIGVIFTLTMLYHAAFLLWKVVIKKSKPTIMPNVRDFQNVVAELKLALGQKADPPKFDRFDYRQKFEYIGLVFGSIILIISGLMLMFPGVVTAVAPGWFVAAAARFHGYEATLAVLTILIWHLYSVVFSPRVFPADTSIFTGKISRERMMEEHPLEYEEMEKADGK
jgi:thiosulfate reductase cytochrome b subunit